MAKAPPFTPGQRASGKTGAPPQDSGGPSVSQALSVLADHVSTPRGQAALKTLRNEVESGAPSRPAHNSDSPGMKQASAHMPPWAKK